jgi:tetratricopeptide (TPR) repeat protein
MMHQISRRGAALQHPALRDLLPRPPVFAGCTQELTAADEAAATSLYWSVIQQDQPQVQAEAAIAVLEQAVRHNPWVGEPQMVLAQLYLSAGRRDEARVAAESALQIFSQWGNAWEQARAMGSLGGVDAHPAAVGYRRHLARAPGQTEQLGAAGLVHGLVGGHPQPPLPCHDTDVVR